MMLRSRALLFLVPLTSGVLLGSAPALAQTVRFQALATAEVGTVRKVGLFAGGGVEAAALLPRLEARLSFNRLGALQGGCMTSCELRDLTLWELGLGIPLGPNAAARSEWAVGIGVGSATEKYDRRRWSWSPYIARTRQPVSALAIRVEGRVRALQDRNGDTLLRGTVKIAAGIGQI